MFFSAVHWGTKNTVYITAAFKVWVITAFGRPKIFDRGCSECLVPIIQIKVSYTICTCFDFSFSSMLLGLAALERAVLGTDA